MKKISQSLYDSLINLMPSLKNTIRNKEYIDSKVSSDLFTIWQTGNKIKSNIFKRPITMSINDVNRMKKAELIRSIGDNIEITKKGEDVIKIMILGDDRSVFENSEIIIDYNQALSNTKNIKTSSKKKMAGSNQESQMRNQANQLGIKYDGEMKDGKGNVLLYAFTDSKTKSSFTVKPGGSVSDKLNNIRKGFGV